MALPIKHAQHAGRQSACPLPALLLCSRAATTDSRCCCPRGHEKGECAASECTLLCNDFQRLGYSRIIVDPSVRLAYAHRDAQDVHSARFVKGIRLTDWADMQAAPPIDWSLTPHRPYAK